jgi:hypothetical protein
MEVLLLWDAEITGNTKVLRDGPTSVFLGENMVDFKGHEHKSARQLAVFTTETRPLPNEVD